jgi:hypothetical protein
MSLTQRLEAWLNANVWRFFRAVFSANHDYPYHDFAVIDNSQGGDPVTAMYAVGTNNVNAHGDQSKRFVSKHANIWTNDPTTVVRFNDSRNVPIVLPLIFGIVEPEMATYEKEFYTNIAAVYYTVPAGKTLWMYFEGVLPEETRDAE